MWDPLKWLALLLAWCGGGAPPEGDTGMGPDTGPGPDTGEEHSECDAWEEDIYALIDEANYCEADADCGDAGMACPFGCNVAVNVDEVDRVKAELHAWREECLYCDYACMPFEELRCEEGRCIVIYEKIP